MSEGEEDTQAQRWQSYCPAWLGSLESNSISSVKKTRMLVAGFPNLQGGSEEREPNMQDIAYVLGAMLAVKVVFAAPPF